MVQFILYSIHKLCNYNVFNGALSKIEQRNDEILVIETTREALFKFSVVVKNCFTQHVMLR